MDRAQFAPDFALKLDGQPIPAELRGSIQSVRCRTGYEGLDEVELTLANDGLRWLDNDLLNLERQLTLSLGYPPSPLTQVFDGEVVARGASFPSGGTPTFTVTAHDRRNRMSDAKKLRSFMIPSTCPGNVPLPDVAIASLITLENLMVPIFDPVGAALSIILGGIEAIAVVTDPDSAQKVIRKQVNQSDYDFLQHVAAENGWDVRVEHDGALGGRVLHFTSSLDNLRPDFTYAYGRSLIEFSPRVSKVGQIFSVGGFVWISAIKMKFSVVLGFDWDRMSLTLAIYPGLSSLKTLAADYLIDEPLTLSSIPRRLVAELIPKLNKRLTATGSVVGEPRLRAGNVLRIEGAGAEFGGLYRATEVTHTLDSGGFRTSFEARKEIWFGSIPLSDQGAIPVRFSI